ncbi:MAG: hypothetical protein K0R54_445 [Clostridiaceae bacterium]|nr:hypothetical protein [Clostridiaceae bacterium]
MASPNEGSSGRRIAEVVTNATVEDPWAVFNAAAAYSPEM